MSNEKTVKYSALEEGLWDRFAAAALTGIVANSERWIGDGFNDEAASMAYAFAGWMIAERRRLIEDEQRLTEDGS